MISILDLLGSLRWFILIIALAIAGAVESKTFKGAFLWFVIGYFLRCASYIMPLIPFLPDFTPEILAVGGIILLIGFPKWLLYPIAGIGIIWIGTKLFTVAGSIASLIIIAVVVLVVILFLCKDSIQSYFMHRRYGSFSY